MKKQIKSTNKPKKNSAARALLITGLLGSLVIASAAIMTFGPAPLRQAQPTLMVVDPQALYNTQTALRNWNALYIHHSKTLDDNLDTRKLGDHFVIGNGNSVGDGEIVITSQWLQQQGGVVDSRAIDAGWISICLEGDYDQAPPTTSQMKRLEQLLSELQKHFGISSVKVRNTSQSVDGIGNLFPQQQLAQTLNP